MKNKCILLILCLGIYCWEQTCIFSSLSFKPFLLALSVAQIVIMSVCLCKRSLFRETNIHLSALLTQSLSFISVPPPFIESVFRALSISRSLKYLFLLFQVTLEHNSNSTNSVLKFVPNIGDAGKFLKCRAENIEMTASQLEDSRSLEINCKAYNIRHTIHRENTEPIHGRPSGLDPPSSTNFLSPFCGR